MSVDSYLSNLGSSLVVRDSEKQSIDRSVDTLISRANAYFGGFDGCLVFGPYARGTILPRKADDHSDVDIMMVFDDDDDYRPQAYINRIKKFAEGKYWSSIVHQDRPSVVLDMQHIRIEMTPGKNYGVEGWYCIPRDASAWQLTKPNSFNSDLVKCNGSNGYKVKPVIRLMKHWNVSKNCRALPSFELESTLVNALMYKYLSCSSYTDYVLASFEAIRWKTNTSRVERAISKVKNAIASEADGFPYSAISEIEDVFPGV